MMPLQRACAAGNQVRNKLSNGPLRVQSNVIYHKVFCNVLAYVSCRGYVGILQRAQRQAVNQGGTADKLYSSLIDRIGLSRTFCYIPP